MRIILALIATLGFLEHTAAEEPAPPLVIEPNAFSYTFSVPDGWAFSFEQAREFGLPLVFFVDGESFHSSHAVMYVNEGCRSDCAGTVQEVIDRIIDSAAARSPELQVADEESFEIDGGPTVPVKILTGSSDERQAKEALAFIEHPEAVLLLVLSTMDESTWDADYQAFRSAVEGHRFFTCSSPDLRVECEQE